MMRGYGYDGYGPFMMGGSWVGDIVMLVLWIALIAGFVILVIWAVRTIAGSLGGHARPTHGASSAAADDACGIAARRYANGEIGREQYEEICSVIKAPR